MSKRDHDRALDRALALASEYRWLLGDGRSAEAEQVERTIDELVGRWTVELDFVWPRSVAERAGVPHVRLASKEASSPAPKCEHCGSVLSAVTWTCVRGEFCPGARPMPRRHIGA